MEIRVTRRIILTFICSVKFLLYIRKRQCPPTDFDPASVAFENIEFRINIIEIWIIL